MLFNSVDFLLFFPVVATLYFIIQHQYRWVLLLFASYYFYMAWNPLYALLIAFSTLIDFSSGILLEKSQNKYQKRLFLLLSLGTNLGLLFTFKYYHFFRQTLLNIFEFLGLSGLSIPSHDWLLPVGISFYTFQTLSYTIDVYRGNMPATRHLGIFALYVSFFPQLVAGPIERSTQLLPQLQVKHHFNYANVTGGLKLIAWGMFKKVVIADRLALMVNQVYESPQTYEGLPLIIATVFFAFQIFCDFSGYSDIAIGTAQVMGFKLMENFKRPYFSKTIKEFWRRWHVSLSFWFRDYLYIPLGGNRVVKWRSYYNLFLTFLISGLWHGAEWTFVVWGALHGFYLIVGIITDPIYQKILTPRLCKTFGIKFLQIAITFSLTCLAWVFFRANSLEEAIYIVSHLFSGLPQDIYWVMQDEKYTKELLRLGQSVEEFNTALWAIFVMELVHFLQRKEDMYNMFRAKPLLFRWAFYIVLVLAILNFGVSEEIQFIYFQF